MEWLVFIVWRTLKFQNVWCTYTDVVRVWACGTEVCFEIVGKAALKFNPFIRKKLPLWNCDVADCQRTMQCNDTLGLKNGIVNKLLC